MRGKDGNGFRNLLTRRLMGGGECRTKAGLRSEVGNLDVFEENSFGSDYLEIAEIPYLLCPPNHTRRSDDPVSSFISQFVLCARTDGKQMR